MTGAPDNLELEPDDPAHAAALDRAHRALDLLHHVSLACRGHSSARAIFEALYRELGPAFAPDACYIAVCDRQLPGRFRAALLVDEGVVEYVEDVAYGELTGLLISSRAPLLFRDLAAERDQLPVTPQSFGNHTRVSRAWLGVPLLLGHEALGVIVVQSYEAGVYDDESLDLLQRIGSLVAVALENASLIERQRALGVELEQRVAARTRELATLAELADELVLQRPLSELLDRILRLVVPQLGMTGGTVRLLVPELDELLLAASFGLSDEYGRALGRVSLSDTLLRPCIVERRPVAIGNLEHSSNWARVGIHFRTLIAVPLQIGARALGVFTVVDREARAIEQPLVEFVELIGNQVAIAVENARLFAERERQVAELTALSEIGQAAGTALDLPTLVRRSCSALGRFMRVDVFTMVVYDPERGIVTEGLSISGEEELSFLRGERPPPDSLTAWVLRHRRTLHFIDLPAEIDRYPGLRVYMIVDEAVPVSWLGAPLIDRDGEAIGVISLQSHERGAYDARAARFLAAAARQLALHVQNVVLLAAEQEARRTADTLREVARALGAAFGSGEVLQVILRELRAVIPYDTASVMLLEGRTLRVGALAGWDERPEYQHLNRMLGQRGAAVSVVEQRRAIVIDDTRASSLWEPHPTFDHVRSWLGVPLIAKGTVLGVLNIDSQRPARFSERDVEVAQAFASQAAVAIENARLYEESIARREQELDIARRIQANLFPRALPRPHGLQIAARCIPAREVGGDFYDCFPLGERQAPGGAPARPIGVMIGDASGKSVPGALLMAIARSVGRSEAVDHEEPPLVLRETNRSVAHDVPRGTFVAMCYATIEPCGRMSIGNAGQMAPILRRASGRVEYLEPPGTTLPLGIVPDTPYEALDLQLDPGDTVVFYTDGLVEAHNHAAELWGFERLDVLVALHGHLPPEALIDRIVADVSEHMGGVPQHDDITLVVVRVE